MSFYLNEEEGELNKEFDDFKKDLDGQVEFHKKKIIESDIYLTEEVLSNVMGAILNGLDAETSEAISPMLSAIAESIIELKAMNEILTAELIEKRVPPPNDLEIN